MAEEITEAEKKAFKQVFDTFDKNKDGHISIGELKAVMNRLGHNPSDEDLAGFVKECDVNKNGTIEFSEFCHCLFRLRKTVFKAIDSDGNGYITPDEVRAGYKAFGVDITLDEAMEIVAKASTRKDRGMSYEEFVAAMHGRPIN